MNFGYKVVLVFFRIWGMVFSWVFYFIVCIFYGRFLVLIIFIGRFFVIVGENGFIV